MDRKITLLNTRIIILILQNIHKSATTMSGFVFVPATYIQNMQWKGPRKTTVCLIRMNRQIVAAVQLRPEDWGEP